MNLPCRIVSLQPSATSILAHIGELDRVVACTKWCREVCPEVVSRDVPIVADSWSAQAEQIIAAKPDLVIASVPYRLEALAEILRAGVAVLALAPHLLADIYRDMAMIAGLVGATERGTELIAKMRQAIADVQSTISAGEGTRAYTGRPRVFCEEWGKPLIASQGWVKELVEAAGGEFLGAPGQKMTADEVASQDPDVLIAAWCGAGDRVPLEKIVRERGWSSLTAAAKGRVYCLRDELLNTPGPALILGLHALAAAIHPELFASVPGMRQIQSLEKKHA